MEGRITVLRWMLALGLAAGVAAQTPAAGTESAPPARAIGVVQSLDAAARQIKLRTDAGAEVAIRYDEKTTFLRVAPGEKDLKNATPIRVSELAAGDRILARGAGAGSVASSIIVMAQADLARKHAAERAEWEQRGTGGLVTAVNLGAREITISTPGLTGARTVVIVLGEGAQLRRYAPDSVKFSDAQPSRLEEIQPGDQVKALGSRSADGARFTAEQVVSGSFQTVVGTIEAVNQRENNLRVRELATRKQWLVVVNPDSNLRQVPPFVEQMLAMRNGGPGEAARGAVASRGAAGAGAGLGPRPRDLQSLLERAPTLTLADLKPGDLIAVASTRSAEAGRMTAITVLAGVEPLLRAGSQGGRQPSIGAWNLDLNMNVGWP